MISIPQRLLGEALINATLKFPNKTAIIVENQQYSYKQFKESADSLARYMVSIGVNRGDRVAVYMNNSWESIVSIYGITLAGAVLLVINPQTKADKLTFILNDSGANILISDKSLKKEYSNSVNDVPQIKKIILRAEIDQPKEEVSENLDIIISSKHKAALPLIIPNDLAALIYTSGSTGTPKGVMMTHQAMVFTTWSLIEYLRLTEDDRLLLFLPLSFDYGFYQLLMSVTIGGTLIVEQSFLLPKYIYKHIQLYKPTVFPGVPSIYAMMISDHKSTALSFDSIKKVTNTAAALPEEFIPDLKEIFPNAIIYKMYGLTECKRVCYLEPELINLKPKSVGKAIPGTEVFILSAEGKPVPPGESGILYIRGPHIMLGYWNNPDLTKEVLFDWKLPSEKILCSKDLFVMDEDGFLYFQGRTDDIIKTRGQKVSPLEIENILHGMKDIKDAAVIGIHDKILGEAIIIFVCLYSGSLQNEKTIQKELLDKMESYMLPKRIIILKDMPMSNNNKIDKKKLFEFL